MARDIGLYRQKYCGCIFSLESSKFRDKVGAALGIGYGNVKTFVKRLNNYGVTREEFLAALKNILSEK